MTAATLTFDVPRSRIPTAPPERRGIARDGVRLLVAERTGLTDTTFDQIGAHLTSRDVLVVNTSTTRPAAIDAIGGRGPLVVHVSTAEGGRRWTVELRLPDGSGPWLDFVPGEVLTLAGGATLRLVSAQAPGPDGVGTRLWRADVDVPDGRLSTHLAHHGRPITYGPDAPQWPLEDYQTVFARHDGSAEMPSAARPFTPRLVADLVSRGITLAPIQLHAGVSSQEGGEPPQPEPYVVPDRTAALVNQVRATGGRVIAVGTTVARALETVATPSGMIEAGRGVTNLILTPDRGVRVVDGLITGWHEANASHLHLLRTVAGDHLVGRAYEAALAAGYLWHEFGDTCLLLRPPA